MEANDTSNHEKPATHWRIAFVSTLLIVVIAAIIGVLRYIGSPQAIRQPTFEHYHFRTQIVINGEAIDFSTAQYQQTYEDGACSADLAPEPFHFHDNTDQLTHVHWDGMRGGDLLKNYGWNFIGGSDSSLGIRYDRRPVIGESVPIYGNALPDFPPESTVYVYIGDETGYQEKTWNEFLNQDLEVFFGKISNLSPDRELNALLRVFFPRVYAHSLDEEAHTELDPAKLVQLNNLIGNVVLFVQSEPPREAQITERFANLVPLQESSCGG